MNIQHWLGVLLMTALTASSGCSGFPSVAEKGDERPFEKPLPVNTAPKKLAIGYGVSAGVKEDGTVWSWGQGLNGDLGTGKAQDQRYVPAPIPGMTDFIEVATGGTHFLALRKDGTVWSWGENRDGQLGYETPKDKYGYYSATPRQIPELKNIISVSASRHSLALDGDGNIYAFGNNSNGRLGLGREDRERHVTPMVVYRQKNAVKVVAGASASALMTLTKEVVYWGISLEPFIEHYQSIGGPATRKGRSLIAPTKLALPEACADFIIGNGVVYCLSDRGFVWSQGGNNVGDLGQGDSESHDGFVRVKNIGRIISASSDGLSTMALDESGNIWQWGSYVRWRPHASVTPPNIELLPIKKPEIKQPISLYSGDGNAALSADGSVYYWSWSRLGNRGTGKPSEEYQSPENWVGPELSLWNWK